MPKIIILNNCAVCPYRRYNKNSQRVCRHSGARVIDAAVTTIPEWCELEDYDETKKETNEKREKARF